VELKLEMTGEDADRRPTGITRLAGTGEECQQQGENWK
jgi:hypothetical protein